MAERATTFNGYTNELPIEFHRWGLWRWKELPPKMQELCRSQEIELKENPQPTRLTATETPSPRPVVITDAEAGTRGCEEVRKDFSQVADIVYLDSAATSFSPEPVLAAMLEFERNYRANVGRGVHRLSRIATQRYWHAHEKVARFIGGTEGTTVFTKNTTEAINMVARGLSFGKGDRVVTTILEPHSNL